MVAEDDNGITSCFCKADRTASEEDKVMLDARFWSGALLGTAVGVIVGIFLAPRSGKDLRTDIQSGVKNAADEVQDRIEHIKENITDSISAVKEGISKTAEGVKQKIESVCEKDEDPMVKEDTVKEEAENIKIKDRI